MKPERIQDRQQPVTPERLHERRGEIKGWEVDMTPNAIYRHFPQPSFTASADFVKKIALAVEKSGRPFFFFGDATGVTVWLGNPPACSVGAPAGRPGVTEADVDLATGINQTA